VTPTRLLVLRGTLAVVTSIHRVLVPIAALAVFHEILLVPTTTDCASPRVEFVASPPSGWTHRCADVSGP
jgi:hypothetical protein